MSAWRATCVLGALGWATLTFGAVYTWTYWPLLAAMTAIGFCGWRSSTTQTAGLAPLGISLCVLMLAISVQVWPISRGALDRVSPEADGILRRYDVAYANAEHGSTDV